MSDEQQPQRVKQEPAADLYAIGERLKRLREERQLSREKVAQALRLHVRMISALEEGDMAALPGPTFIMGYLRSYARLLDIPASEVALFSVRDVEKSTTITSHVSEGGGAVPRRVSNRSRPMLLLLLLLLLLVAVYGWVMEQGGELSLPSFPSGDVASHPESILPPTIEPGEGDAAAAAL